MAIRIIKKRKKSKYRTTSVDHNGKSYTRYTNDLMDAFNWAKPKKHLGDVSGTVSVLNPSTNRFKKRIKYGW